MNVLFISQDGLTDALGQSQVLPYIVGLAGGEIKYSVISLEKPEAASAHEEVSARLRNAGVKWVELPYSKGLSVLSNCINYRKLKSALASELKKGKVDVLHCRSYVGQSAAWRFARKRKIPIIFDMRGFWADERLEGGIWSRYNPVMLLVYRYFKIQERKWIRKSPVIISLSRKAKDFISVTHGDAAGKKCVVIPCCADEDFFNPGFCGGDRIRTFRTSLGIGEGEKILGYAGSTGTWYMVGEMLKQFAALEKSGRVSRMLFVTGGKKEAILEEARKHGIPEEKITIYNADRNEMPLCYSLFDLGIFYIKPGFSKIASSPTKLGEMLLMGIPVICNSGVGDLSELFEKEKIGICHDINDKSFDITSALSQLPGKGDASIRTAGLEYFSLSGALTAYRKVLQMIGKK